MSMDCLLIASGVALLDENFEVIISSACFSRSSSSGKILCESFLGTESFLLRLALLRSVQLIELLDD